MLKKREQTLSIANKPLLIFTCQIRIILLVYNDLSVESIYVLCILFEMSLLQSVSISCCKDRNKKTSYFCNKRAKLIIKRRFSEIAVQIPDKMNQTFLLSTVYRVIATIEIRYEDTLVFSKRCMSNICLSCLG